MRDGDEFLPLRKFLDRAFDRSGEPIRLLHGNGEWHARIGRSVLHRVDGSTTFRSLDELLGVLASVDLRFAHIEWDGLTPIRDLGRPNG